MIKPAQRLAQVKEYYFSKKMEQIRQMRAQGKNVINLGIGSPDMAPSDATIQACVKALSEPTAHGYASYNGLPELRSAMADWYKSTYGVTVDFKTQVLPLLGSKEGIFYTSLAFLNPGDEALVPDPGYPTYTSATLLAGAKPIFYDLVEKNSYLPDFKALEKMKLKKVKLMWVNYPHMPTGTIGSDKLFEDLIKFGKKHKILICHDNPYSLVNNPERARSLISFDPEFKTSLELNSMSKAFSMAGWRVGMMLAHSKVLSTVFKVKSQADTGMFLPVQKAAVDAFQNSASWHIQRNQIYKTRSELAKQILNTLGFSVSDQQAGMFLWGKAPSQIKNVATLIDHVLEDKYVFLTPGIIFGKNGLRHARISLCANEAHLKEALARLKTPTRGNP